MYGNQYQSTPPVREGEEIDVTIEAVGEKGDGIAKKEGFVIFVPGTKTGDEVRIKVTRVLAKVGFGEKIGEAEKKAAPAEQKSAEPEFDPQEHLDSEDFGDEPAGDSEVKEMENETETTPEEETTEEPEGEAEDAPEAASEDDGEEQGSEDDSESDDSAEEDAEKTE